MYSLSQLLAKVGLSPLSSAWQSTTMAVKKIGTHNGTFHCDEVLACYMLKQCDQYKDAEIIRTRDPDVLKTCDIVVDVGGVFDPENHRYDHHQKTFTETMHSLNPSYRWTTKLSSAGLVYYHFGKEVIGNILNRLEVKRSDGMTDIMYDKIYQFFVEEVDGVDNGINVAEGLPRYAQTSSLSSRVGHHNPWWNQPDADETTQFHKAMKMVGEEFEDRLSYYAQCWWPARTMVETAIKKRKEVDESGEILVFDQGGCPWKDHLFTIEEEQKIEPGIKFALYKDKDGNWRIQCVPLVLGKFENRLDILADWRGLRGDELATKSGIPGCIFVHNNGFIGGNKTYDGALEMAKRTLADRDQGEPSENGGGDLKKAA